MDYITKIEFILFSEFGEVTPVVSETFDTIDEGSALSIKRVSTGYSTLKFQSRTLEFGLDLEDTFFNTFTNSENYINEINRHYIKAYDENNDLFFTGLVGRNDFKINNAGSRIVITAKDLTSLLYYIQKNIVTPVNVLDFSLKSIENLYNYYLDLGFKYYFGSSFVATNYKDLAYDESFLNISEIEYANKDLTIQDLINMFFSVNSHIVRYEETTNKIVIDNTNRFNFDIPSATIHANDDYRENESNLTIGKLENGKISDLVSDDPGYLFQKNQIISLNDANYNQFTEAINKSITTTVSRRVNSYTLSMNQIVRYKNNSFSIKGINPKPKYYDLILWNSRNPITNHTIWVATNKFDSISNKPQNDIIIVATNEIDGNKDNNNIIITASNEITANEDNNRNIFTSTNKY